MKEAELSATESQDETPKSNSLLFIEKLTKAIFSLYYINCFMVPSVDNLIEKYPKAIIIKIINMILGAVTISLVIIVFFLYRKNGHFENENKTKPKRCSKVVCPSCAARKKYPKWFQLKYLLLVSMTAFSFYFCTKIRFFFKTDQTINLHRLSQLFRFQLGWICTTALLFYFYDASILHSGFIEGNRCVNGKGAMSEGKTGQLIEDFA
ncbi:XXYS1_4_G0039190.mRNA.1.CDS.1 [Saccharomyces cerevisiae]|nr:XXYS1_4_G0039190.mRNA.1.CDS.1 [Saccharomyces cerevisiae]